MKNKICSIILISTILLIQIPIFSETVDADEQLQVNLSCPNSVIIGDNFDAILEVDDITDFDAANFDITYDETKISITDISNGEINGTAIPVGMWDLIENNKIRVILNIPGITGASGNGTLATIHCTAINTGTTNFIPSNYIISDKTSDEIHSVWNLCSTSISENHPPTTTTQTPSNHPNNQGTISQNTEPIANASLREPYRGFADEDIRFDGSLSYDTDTGDYVDNFLWDFGDGTNGSGKIINHSFSDDGLYYVKLTVWDNHGLKCTEDYITMVEIIKANNPPSEPAISGPVKGNINVEYEYAIVSYDEDEDNLQYNVTFGDNNYFESKFTKSGQEIEINHTWKSPGEYMILVKSYDNLTESKTTTLNVFIDVLLIDDEIKGYLVDNNSDGIYETFQEYETGNNSLVKTEETNLYLIDINDDKTYDYTYNVENQSLSKYDNSKKLDHTYNITIAIISIVLVLILFLLYIFKTKK